MKDPETGLMTLLHLEDTIRQIPRYQQTLPEQAIPHLHLQTTTTDSLVGTDVGRTDPRIKLFAICCRKLHPTEQYRYRTGWIGDAIPVVRPILFPLHEVRLLPHHPADLLMTRNLDQGDISPVGVAYGLRQIGINRTQGHNRLIQCLHLLLIATEIGFPIAIIRRQTETTVKPHIVQNDATGLALMPSQPPTHHLQVFGQRKCRTCQLDKLHIGTVEPLREEIHIHQDLDLSGPEFGQIRFTLLFGCSGTDRFRNQTLRTIEFGNMLRMRDIYGIDNALTTGHKLL